MKMQAQADQPSAEERKAMFEKMLRQQMVSKVEELEADDAKTEKKGGDDVPEGELKKGKTVTLE